MLLKYSGTSFPRDLAKQLVIDAFEEDTGVKVALVVVRRRAVDKYATHTSNPSQLSSSTHFISLWSQLLKTPHFSIAVSCVMTYAHPDKKVVGRGFYDLYRGVCGKRTKLSFLVNILAKCSIVLTTYIRKQLMMKRKIK